MKKILWRNGAILVCLLSVASCSGVGNSAQRQEPALDLPAIDDREEPKAGEQHKVRLAAVIDVREPNPETRGTVSFVGDHLVVVSLPSYPLSTIVEKSFYVFDFVKGVVVDTIVLPAGRSAFIPDVEEESILVAVEDPKDVFSTYRYSLVDGSLESVDQADFLKRRPPPLPEDFAELKRKTDFAWAGYRLSPWRWLRSLQETYASEEYSLVLMEDARPILTFPYVRVVDSGQFSVSPSGSAIAIDGGYYMGDVFPDHRIEDIPRSIRSEIHSGDPGEFYNYGVFIYQLDEDYASNEEDQPAHLAVFPAGSEAIGGDAGVSTFDLDASHLSAQAVDGSEWGSGVVVRPETDLLGEPRVGASSVFSVGGESTRMFIVRSEYDSETGLQWSLLENRAGLRGWIQKDERVSVDNDLPYFADP